jgi:hypothetical protein
MIARSTPSRAEALRGIAYINIREALNAFDRQEWHLCDEFLRLATQLLLVAEENPYAS